MRMTYKLDGIREAQNRLSRLPVAVAREVGDTMREEADKLAASAAAAVKKHPSGLWKKAGNPRYAVKRPSLMVVTVGTPGGAVGKAEAISEFASQYKSPQGRALANGLTSVYGRPGGRGGGRVLWKTYDNQEDQIINAVEDAVERGANG